MSAAAPAPEPVRRRCTLDETPTRDLIRELAHRERVGALDRDLEADQPALQALARCIERRH